MTMNDGELVGYLQKHLVPIFFEFQKDAETRSGVITTFILSVDDRWFLVTAGHCIESIEKLIGNGYKIQKCRLIDSMGLAARYPDSIPFNYERGKVIRLDAGEEFSSLDYAAIPLSTYYRQLLEKNNNEALNEDTWKHYPLTVDFYTLLGVPGELTAFTPENVALETTLIFVKRLTEQPKEFEKAEPSLFYGHVDLGEQLNSIKGMSGGPIFAFYVNVQGEMRYWLVALQSNWNENTRNLVACPTRIFGAVLTGIIQNQACE